MIIHVKQLWNGIGGIALWPFIFIDRKISGHQKTELLNHERIHIRQQLELAIVFFYLAYLLNYLINLFIYRNHMRAYRNIIFEREAYAQAGNADYLKTRRWFGFLEYI